MRAWNIYGSSDYQLWLIKLSEYDLYDLSIEYKDDKENIVVDALSRKELSNTEVLKCTTNSGNFELSYLLGCLKQEMSTPVVCMFRIYLGIFKQENPMTNGVLEIIYCFTRTEPIWKHSMSSTLSLSTSSMIEFLTKSLNKTFRVVFYRPRMRKTVKTYVRNCDISKKQKSDHALPATLLQRLPIPTHPGQQFLDFIECLSMSFSMNSIIPNTWTSC